jgi:hypothetical protein
MVQPVTMQVGSFPSALEENRIMVGEDEAVLTTGLSCGTVYVLLILCFTRKSWYFPGMYIVLTKKLCGNNKYYLVLT